MSAKDQIKQIVDFFKKEPQLKDKTDGMAEGLLLGAQLADDANELSKETDASFKALQREYTENGNGSQTTAEITVARDGELVLDDRLKRDFGNVNAQLVQKADLSQLNAVAGGNPNGQYNSLTELQTALPNGADGIYVIRESGYWYSWNGTEWVIGLKFQETQSPDVDFLEEDVQRMQNGKVNYSLDNIYIASANHPSQTEGKTVATAGYITTNILRFQYGDKLEINAGASENVSILSEWTDTGVYVGSLIVGDGTKRVYTHEVTKPYEYLRVSNSTSIVLAKDMHIKITSRESLEQLSEQVKTISNKDTSIPVSALAVRKPVIDFQIDDGNSTDPMFFNIFKSYGFTCGFALKTDTTNIDQYLDYQKDGFEVLAHSTDNDPMNDGTLSVAEVEQKFKETKTFLENAGFDIKGWVTPSSELNTIYFDSLKKYYEYAITVYFGTYDGSTGTPQNLLTDSALSLKRVSMESSTIDNCKLAVDRVIAEGGYLSFYAHNFSKGLTESELHELLTYVKGKVDDDDCLVLKPYDAVKHYYTIRHSDFLALLP